VTFTFYFSPYTILFGVGYLPDEDVILIALPFCGLTIHISGDDEDSE